MRGSHVVAGLCLLSIGGCGTSEAPDTPSASGWHLEQIVENVSYPWGVAFLPGGDMLVTERTRGLRVIRNGLLLPDPVAAVPVAHIERQGGYLDVLADPDFADNRMIYLSFAKGDAQANATTVVRARLSEDFRQLSDVETLFESNKKKRGGLHFGSRFALLADGSLVFGLGEGYFYADDAQNRKNHLGSVIRIRRDGSVPADNPFPGQADIRPEIFTYGHRNVQGTAFDPATGLLYVAEHGPKGGDEINILRSGANHGWPLITYGVNYDGTLVSRDVERTGMAQPIHRWTPSIGPSGLALYRGALYPQWQGDLLVSALVSQDIRRLDMAEDGKSVLSEHLVYRADERLRHVAVAPDGEIIVLTDAPDGGIYRLRPTSLSGK